jgi:hypothetical protein
MNATEPTDKTAWAYRVTKITGAQADESPTKVGSILLYKSGRDETSIEMIWDDKTQQMAYCWHLERICKVKLENGKVIAPDGAFEKGNKQ